MIEQINYILVCGTSGTDLRGATRKLGVAIPDSEIQDIEDVLCALPDAEELLAKSGHTKPHNVDGWPRMYDLTWHLSRSQIIELWKIATKNALHQLKISPKRTKILCCHLTYYGGKRHEFYSPIVTSFLQPPGINPSHVLLLIDDIYDMYARITAANTLFHPQHLLSRIFGNEQKQERTQLTSLQQDRLAYIFLNWQIGVMSHLLSWRYMDTLFAEHLAVQFKANFLVGATKQLTEVVASWIQKPNPLLVYLSHPISRPRRLYRDSNLKQWHVVVHNFNELQSYFLPKGLTCIMPTGIDEYRIHAVKGSGKSVKSGKQTRREPTLEDRWPLPSDIDSVIYSMPAGCDSMNHASILAPKIWDPRSNTFTPLKEPLSKSLQEKIDSLLGALERQIEMQVSSRDHLFVSLSPSLLVYRPLFQEGVWSGGVEAEIRHWRLLAAGDKQKRAVFIHFTEDIQAFLDASMPQPEGRAAMTSAIRTNMYKYLEEHFGLHLQNAEQVCKNIAQGRPIGMLEESPSTPHDMEEIQRQFPAALETATRDWMLGVLAGEDHGQEVSKDQISVWIVPNVEALRSKYDEISKFLTAAIKPNSSGLENLDLSDRINVRNLGW